jgi:hypothetical protein
MKGERVVWKQVIIGQMWTKEQERSKQATQFEYFQAVRQADIHSNENEGH